MKALRFDGRGRKHLQQLFPRVILPPPLPRTSIMSPLCGKSCAIRSNSATNSLASRAINE